MVKNKSNDKTQFFDYKKNDAGGIHIDYIKQNVIETCLFYEKDDKFYIVNDSFNHQQIELSINEFLDSEKRFVHLQSLIGRIELQVNALIRAINEEGRPSNTAGSGPGGNAIVKKQ
ncbi:unnamed protein product [Rotaria sp. Silwood2]|nr:unnamed protein product [Rotaria sp. Silwood2]